MNINKLDQNNNFNPACPIRFIFWYAPILFPSHLEIGMSPKENAIQDMKNKEK